MLWSPEIYGVQHHRVVVAPGKMVGRAPCEGWDGLVTEVEHHRGGKFRAVGVWFTMVVALSGICFVDYW